MEIAKVSVSGVAATTVEATTIPAGIIGATIAVEYGPEWGGMIKNVSFRGAKDVTVVNVGNVVKLPQEVAAKPNMYIQIGFTGVSGDGTVLIPTLWAYLGTTKPASPVNVEGGSTPPVWAQVVAMIGDLNQLNTPSQDNLVNAINDAAKSGNGNVDLSGCVKSVNGVKPDADGNVEVKVSSDSGQNGNGLSADLSTALINYYTHVMPNFDDANGLSYINAILTALGAETRGEPSEPDTPVEPDEPDEPVTPEVTLTSISATYSGGDVAVGTALTDLTGIVVTAHYSDGTSEAITGYTLSGEIAEGSNTVTVSYGGKTTTFTVTGIAESGGEEEPELPSVEIPADATRLAYIESNGNQYIDTGYQPGAKDTIELTMETAYAGTTARVDWFGVSDGTNLWMLGTNLTTMYFGRSGNNTRASAPTAAQIFGDSGDSLKFKAVSRFAVVGGGYTHVGCSCSIYDMDGNLLGTGSTMVADACVFNDIAANMYLFASNNSGTLHRQSVMKLYECIFYAEDGTEKHHYVPVKDANDVVCLYDAIDKKYLYNAGTGDFVGGEVA